MTLPNDLQQAFTKFSSRKPLATLRALYNLEGELGETYLALSESSLVLFSKKIGHPYQTFIISLHDIRNTESRLDNPFLFFELKTDSRNYVLRFTVWEQEEVKRLAERINPVSKITDTGPPLETKASKMTPLSGFCAGIYAMLEVDGKVDQGEIQTMASIIKRPEVIQSGIQICLEKGHRQLQSELKEILNADQKICLMANLIAAAMSDGILRSKEQELLDSFRKEFELSDTDYQQMYDQLLVKYDLRIFKNLESENSESTPIQVFCSALLAMMEVDGVVDNGEIGFVYRVINDPDIISHSRSHLEKVGQDSIVKEAGNLLNQPQKNCLLTNLISMAMVDALLRGKELELLNQFRNSMGFSQQDYQQTFDQMMIKNNFRIFADKGD